MRTPRPRPIWYRLGVTKEEFIGLVEDLREAMPRNITLVLDDRTLSLWRSRDRPWTKGKRGWGPRGPKAIFHVDAEEWERAYDEDSDLWPGEAIHAMGPSGEDYSNVRTFRSFEEAADALIALTETTTDRG